MKYHGQKQWCHSRKHGRKLQINVVLHGQPWELMFDHGKKRFLAMFCLVAPWVFTTVYLHDNAVWWSNSCSFDIVKPFKDHICYELGKCFETADIHFIQMRYYVGQIWSVSWPLACRIFTCWNTHWSVHLLEQQVHTTVDISTTDDGKVLLSLLECTVCPPVNRPVSSEYPYIENSFFLDM